MSEKDKSFFIPALGQRVKLPHWAAHTVRVDVPVVSGMSAAWACPHEDAVIVAVSCMNGKFPGAVLKLRTPDDLVAYEAPLEALYHASDHNALDPAQVDKALEQYDRITKAGEDAIARMIDLIKTAPTEMWVRPSERGVVFKTKKAVKEFFTLRDPHDVDADGCFPGGLVRDDSPAESIVYNMRNALTAALGRIARRDKDMIVKVKISKGEQLKLEISDADATSGTACVLLTMIA